MSMVKICGLQSIQDIKAVNRAMPDFIGFVFAESMRRVDADTAARLKEKIDSRIRAVGVFVNQEIETISGLYRDGVIDLVQLHGDEDDQYIKCLRECCDCQIIKAVGISKEIPPLPEGADYLMFDTASKQRGGTGEAFDWSILKNYQGQPYFLAGGLTPENVSEVLHLLHPFCVDVSSGVETDGFKDPDKIYKFTQMVRRIK